MKYSTSKFTNLIRSDIQKGDIRRAIKLLVEALPEKDPYRRKALIFSSQYNQLYERELLGFGRDNENIALITNSILIFLRQLEERDPQKLELRASPLRNKIEPLNPRKRKSSKSKGLNQIFVLQSPYIKYPLIALALLIFIIWIGKPNDKGVANTERKTEDIKRTLESNINQSQVWALVVENHSNFSEAEVIRNKYPNREIDVLKIGNEYLNVVLGFDSKEEANSKSRKLRKYWPDLRTINLGDYCEQVSWSDNLDYLDCK